MTAVTPIPSFELPVVVHLGCKPVLVVYLQIAGVLSPFELPLWIRFFHAPSASTT
jgi:hypothetical protein